MNRKSFVDLTALLDVMLILFFAALINMASSADVLMEENIEVLDQFTEEKEKTEKIGKELDYVKKSLEEALKDLELSETELSSLYGGKSENLDDYREILSRISKIDIMLAGQSNELWINDEEKNINIVRERLETSAREVILRKEITSALNFAIDHRDKSDIIFLKVSVKDIDVYKYAYDYLIEIIDDIILEYGKDKVMISREF